MGRILAAILLAFACLPALALDHTHAAWDALLKKHVRYAANGNASQVSYAAMARERAALKAVLDEYQRVTKAEFVLAMRHGIGLNKVLGTIHTYPTLAEANKYVAGVWKRSKVTQGQMAFARSYNEWMRGEAGLGAVLGKLSALRDKRPYYEAAESHGDD